MRRAVFGLVLGGILAVSPPAPAGEGNGTPPFVPWAAALPSLTAGYRPSAAAECPARDVSCVDAVIATMQARLAPLLEDCDDDAVLALAYLRFTEELRRVAGTGFFDDESFIFHQDAAFAQLYFDAYDAWHSGDVAATPPSYRIAFDAADRGTVTGLGNGMLGLSAHINRDLPFVLAAIGLVKPDGTSRKVDHDRVNEILNGAIEPVLDELTARLDPELEAGQIDGAWLDEAAVLQIFATWREGAWRNAEALVNAPTPELRALVAQSIETEAVLIGETIKAATSYTPADAALGRRAARDAHCTAARS